MIVSKRNKIKMENLTHIRESTNRKKKRKNRYNGKIQDISVHTKQFKRRLNTWPFRRLQRYMEYKAKWAGIHVKYVNPAFTTQTCSMCGLWVKLEPNERVFRCPRCGLVLDRDLNAALNTAKRDMTQDERLRFGRNRPPVEAVNLPLRRRGADGGEVRLAAKNS